MDEYIEKPDMQYILHFKSDKKVEKRLIDYCLDSVLDVFEDTGLTADVQPVKHGRWKLTNNPSFRKCSECGAWWSSDNTDNYCPKCGARMDGDIE